MSTWWKNVQKAVQDFIDNPPPTNGKQQITDCLTQFRIAAEVEAETSIVNVETNLALALDDICQALGLFQEDVYQILGATAYTYAYEAPIFQHENQRDPVLTVQDTCEEQATALLANLRELSSVKAGHIVLRS